MSHSLGSETMVTQSQGYFTDLGNITNTSQISQQVCNSFSVGGLLLTEEAINRNSSHKLSDRKGEQENMQTDLQKKEERCHFCVSWLLLSFALNTKGIPANSEGMLWEFAWLHYQCKERKKSERKNIHIHLLLVHNRQARRELEIQSRAHDKLQTKPQFPVPKIPSESCRKSETF